MWLLIAAATASSVPFGQVGNASADLDGDGHPESIVAGFNPEKEVIVRVTGGKGKVHTLNLGTRSDIMGPRDVLELSTTDPRETGVALVHIRLPGGEYCGSGNTEIYVSYTSADSKAPLKNALEVADFSDAPIWSTVKTTFDAKAKTVRIDSSYGAEDQVTETATEVRHLVRGVFVAAEKE